MKSKKDNGSSGNGVYSVEKNKVPVSALELGMFVCELDRPWNESPFLFQGFPLRKIKDIEAVQKHCDFVFIDTEKQIVIGNNGRLHRSGKKALIKESRPSLKGNPSVVGGNAAGEGEGPVSSMITSAEFNAAKEVRVGKTPEKTATFEQEFSRASSIFSEARGVVSGMMDEVRLGNSVDTKLARQVVSACVDSVITNQDAMLWLSQLKNKDSYTAEHSLNVCLLSIAFGRHLGLNKRKLEELGLCGMLHDMGKVRTPIEILNKATSLSPEEYDIIKLHPADGRDILMAGGGVSSEVIDVVYGHHEWVNGSGYPQGLTADELSPYTKMVAIVDAYDAITSNRTYDSGRTHMEALNILTNQRATHFDADYTIQFIECIGIFPPGCVVELSNGEVGIVVEVDPQQKLRPKVMIILGKDKKVCPEQVVDLKEKSTDVDGQSYRILGVVSASKYKINIHKYHEKNIIIKAEVEGVTH